MGPRVRREEPAREPGISSVSDKQVTAAENISILMAHGQDLVASRADSGMRSAEQWRVLVASHPCLWGWAASPRGSETVSLSLDA